jgi:hypothetical protein
MAGMDGPTLEPSVPWQPAQVKAMACPDGSAGTAAGSMAIMARRRLRTAFGSAAHCRPGIFGVLESKTALSLLFIFCIPVNAVR